MLRHPSVLLEIMAVDSTCEINRPISQIPYCTCSISRSALFRTECSDWNIVGYETGAVWDLWIRSIVGMRQVEQHWCYLNNNEQINFHKHHFIRTIYCTYHCNQLIHGVSDNSICQSYSQLYKSYHLVHRKLRLLHSPSLVAVGLSMGMTYGLELIRWHHPFVMLTRFTDAYIRH